VLEPVVRNAPDAVELQAQRNEARGSAGDAQLDAAIEVPHLRVVEEPDPRVWRVVRIAAEDADAKRTANEIEADRNFDAPPRFVRVVEFRAREWRADREAGVDPADLRDLDGDHLRDGVDARHGSGGHHSIHVPRKPERIGPVLSHRIDTDGDFTG